MTENITPDPRNALPSVEERGGPSPGGGGGGGRGGGGLGRVIRGKPEEAVKERFLTVTKRLDQFIKYDMKTRFLAIAHESKFRDESSSCLHDQTFAH